MKVKKSDALFVFPDYAQNTVTYKHGHHSWHATAGLGNDLISGYYNISGEWSDGWILIFGSRKVSAS